MVSKIQKIFLSEQIPLSLSPGYLFHFKMMLHIRDRPGSGLDFPIQAQTFFDLPGFFFDYRPRIRPRSINQTQEQAQAFQKFTHFIYKF